MAFVQSVTALVEARDKAFVERLATDLDLSFKDLWALYEHVSEAAIKVPRKYKKREAKEVEAERKCQGTTAKKEPCKFSALPGECFCKRHLNPKSENAKSDTAAAAKPAKEEEPVHTHPLDDKVHTECKLCQSHGNPLAAEDFDCEVVKA